MIAWLRMMGALGCALLLPGCLVTPGKFESSLDIRADRQFTFAYKGEIIASDMGKGLNNLGDGEKDETPLGDTPPEGEESALITPVLWDGQSTATPPGAEKEERFDDSPADKADPDEDSRLSAIAAALMKEKGFRAARYMGNRKFEIDYVISGTLTHAFLFPFNIDAQIVLPFVAVELRGDDRVRVKAPGFANEGDKSRSMMGGGAGEDAAKALNGSFTLTTDAEIVSQNQEEGPSSIPGGKQLRWSISPLTGEAPMAVLRFPGR
jgi:hypothetical protein